MHYFYVGNLKGIAEKPTKIYVGVNNIARRVKRIYIGDQSGIARLIFDSVKKISFSKDIEEISVETLHHYYDVGSASINKYAIFAGGYNRKLNTVTNNVDIFDNNGICVATKSFSKYATGITGCNNDKYAIFAGGSLDSKDNIGNTITTPIVMYISSDLTHGYMSTANQLDNPTYGMNSCKFNGNAIFAGGSTGNLYSEYWYTSAVIAYDNNLIKTQLPSLDTDRISLGFATTKDKFLLAAGGTSNHTIGPKDTVEVYDTTFTKYRLSSTLSHSGNTNGISVGKYTLFKPKFVSTNESTIDIFDDNLTKLTPIKSPMLGASCNLSDGEIGLFANGNTIESFDSNLTRSELSVSNDIISMGFTGVDTIFLYCKDIHAILKLN